MQITFIGNTFIFICIHINTVWKGVIAISVSQGAADPKHLRTCADEAHSLGCFSSHSGEIHGFLSCTLLMP